LSITNCFTELHAALFTNVIDYLVDRSDVMVSKEEN
jgi:hypothetical protein